MIDQNAMKTLIKSCPGASVQACIGNVLENVPTYFGLLLESMNFLRICGKVEKTSNDTKEKRKKEKNNKKDCELMSTTATGALSVAKVCSDLTSTFYVQSLAKTPEEILVCPLFAISLTSIEEEDAVRQHFARNRARIHMGTFALLVRLRRLAKPLGPDFAGFRKLINFGVAFRAPFVPTVQNSASLRWKVPFLS
ncbi:hypothetical protein V1478_017109 [Vespula squamosa]|uniref:Uncharacterized protein n=1 Tax=Vespula squamosa TaxID=30214 RepID=A0ABD1ZYH4_VESSQ